MIPIELIPEHEQILIPYSPKQLREWRREKMDCQTRINAYKYKISLEQGRIKSVMAKIKEMQSRGTP